MESKTKKPDVKTGSKDETPSDLAPQIAKRAYELYEKGGRKDGRAVQDWMNAEREVKQTKDKTHPEPKSEVKPDSKDETHSNLTPQIVKRVHELYEELGRKDVRAVEDLEKKKKDEQKDASDKKT